MKVRGKAVLTIMLVVCLLVGVFPTASIAESFSDEPDGHLHGPECYEQILTCGYPVNPDDPYGLDPDTGHIHTDECWEQGDLICGMEGAEDYGIMPVSNALKIYPFPARTSNQIAPPEQTDAAKLAEGYVWVQTPGASDFLRAPYRENHNDHMSTYMLADCTDSSKQAITYCCDLVKKVIVGTHYKRISMETAAEYAKYGSYYSVDQAAMIRAILLHSFPFIDGSNYGYEQFVANVINAGYTLSGNVDAGQVVAAVQLAVWQQSNKDSGSVYKDSRKWSVIKDADRFASGIYKVSNKTYASPSEDYTSDPVVKANINAMVSYLTSLAPDYGEDATLVLDSSNISYEIVKIGSGNTVDLIVTIMLQQPLTTNDKVDVTVSEGREILATATNVTGDTITLRVNDVSADSDIAVSLTGSQYLAHNVYFYTPEGGRDAAQSFVGVASGDTPVSASFSFRPSAISKELKLVKHAEINGNPTEIPVVGATFDLYKGSTPVITGLTTDANGEISVSFLAKDGITSGDYYWVETAAPAGYTGEVYLPASGTTQAYNTGVGSVEFAKKDGITGETMDAQFVLTYSDGTHTVTQNVETKDGILSLAGLIDGHYELAEKSVPGYQDHDLISFDVVNGEIQNLAGTEKGIIYNTPNTGNLVIQKVLAGNAADKTSKWEFSIGLNGTNLAPEYPYTIAHADGTTSTGTIKVNSSGGVDKIFCKDGKDYSVYGGLAAIGEGDVATISGLPLGTLYYVHEEQENTAGYTTTYEGEAGEISLTSTASAVVTNAKNLMKVSVTKVWTGDDAALLKRPTQVSVQLYRDDTPVGEPVVLNAGNSWSYTWEELEVGEYDVREVSTDKNYVVSYEHTAGEFEVQFTITNTYAPKTSTVVVRKNITLDGSEYGVDGTSIKETFEFTLESTTDNENTYKRTISVPYGGEAKFDNVPIGNYILTENIVAATTPDYNYKGVTFVLNGETTHYTKEELETENKGITITVGEAQVDAQIVLDVTNEYTSKVSNVIVHKDISQDGELYHGENPIKETFEFTLSGKTYKGTDYTQTITVNYGKDGEFKNVPYGTYTVTEVITDVNVDKYDFMGATFKAQGKTQHYTQAELADGDKSIEIVVDAKTTEVELKLDVTNEYDKQTGELYIQKILSGNGADMTSKWNFAIALNGEVLKDEYPYVITHKDGTKTEGVVAKSIKEDKVETIQYNGKTYTVYRGMAAIGDGDLATVSGIAIDTLYHVSENEENTKGYTTTYEHAAGVITLKDETKDPVIVKAINTKEVMSITATKVWAGDDLIARPQQISVQLYRDGKPVNSPVVLSETNNWTTTWTKMIIADYEVKEVEVPEHYTVSYATVNGEYEMRVTVTNTYDRLTPTPPPPPPQALLDRK